MEPSYFLLLDPPFMVSTHVLLGWLVCNTGSLRSNRDNSDNLTSVISSDFDYRDKEDIY